MSIIIKSEKVEPCGGAYEVSLPPELQPSTSVAVQALVEEGSQVGDDWTMVHCALNVGDYCYAVTRRRDKREEAKKCIRRHGNPRLG